MSKIKDKGFDAVINEMRKLDGVEVGLLEDASPYPDGTPVQDVAAFNEFGTHNIPSRPFLRHSFDQYQREIEHVQDRVVGQVISGRISAADADEQVGAKFEGRIREVIDKWKTPRNADSTIRKKGRDDPLQDTMHMRDSIDYRRLK